MKTKQDNPRPAASRLKEFFAKKQKHDFPPKVVEDINKVLNGLENYDHDLRLKDTQIVNITQQKNDLQQLVTTKTSEIQSKNSLLLQKDVQLGQLQGNIVVKDSELLTKSQLLSQSASKVKKVTRKLAQEAQSKNQLFIQKELEQEELRVQKESEVRNKSAEKNRIIEELTINLSNRDEEILTKSQLLSQTSHKVKKVNRKVAAKDKLISDKDQEIEALKVLLAQKEAEKAELIVQKEELLVQKDEEIDDKSFIKNLTINSLLEELIVKYTENNNLKMVNLLKQIEIQENEEVISQKNNELLIKDLLIEFQQDEVELREEVIADLKLLNQQLSHVDFGVQINGNEVGTQVNEIDLAGHHLESQSDFELI